MILQAFEYERMQGLDLQEFFDSTEGKFKTELGRSWAAEVVARRSEEVGRGRQQK
jgi:putative hydrolase of HD superfamily